MSGCMIAITSLKDTTLAAIIESLKELRDNHGLSASDADRMDCYQREMRRRAQARKDRRKFI